ncbi:MAG: rhomboid family intramembrane serine protease, partial [Cyanobacteria bacterium P01_G01_bin.49]
LWIDSFGNLKYSVIFVSSLLISTALAGCIATAVYYYYTSIITVKSQGILGYDWRGNRSFVAWDEIEIVEPYRFFGCKYFRLFFSNSTTPLWIPLFLENQKQFNQTIIERTDQTNPLHLALLNIDTLFAKVPFHGKGKNKLKSEHKRQSDSKNNFLQLKSISQRNNNTPPWMEKNVFSTPLEANTYGYCIGEKLVTCSRPSLIENIKSDSKKLINLVWTPDTLYLVSPEEVSWLVDALHAREKTHFKQALRGDVINCLTWGGIFWMNWTSSNSMTVNESTAVKQIMLFNLVAIAIIPALEHGWGFYQCRLKTPQRLAQRSQENRYAAWVKNSDAPWTRLLVGCIALVAIVQVIILFIPEMSSSIETAGIVKLAIWQGEVWRLLTGTLLHGSLLHFMFNIGALLVLGKLIEVITHRAYVPLVFLISALSGSVFSLLFIPDTTSVGASGGIMGLLGFLFILGRKHQHLFPAAYQQMLAKATIYTFLAGLLAYQVIDNPAHLGGFLAGILLGWKFIPHRKFKIGMLVSRPIKIMSMISAGIIAIATLFTIYKMVIV